jgi:hypothetical protein
MTKGGAVKSSCLASAGIFSGIWNNVQPRFVDASVTVLTTAIGYQTLFDSSNNNIFNIADSGLIEGIINTQTSFSTDVFLQTGFINRSEARPDDNDNENRQRDNGELFLDYNNDQQFDKADGLFNGP